MDRLLNRTEETRRRIQLLSGIAYAPALLLGILIPINAFYLAYDALLFINASLLLACLLSLYVAWKFTALIQTQAQADSNLSKSATLHELYFEKSPAIMFVKDLNGKYHLANKSFREFAKMKELRNTDLVGSIQKDVFPKGIAEEMAEQDLQVIEYEQAMAFQLQVPSKDGEEHYSVLRFPIYDESGALVGIGGIADNRTDQVNARRALRVSEEQFRSLVEGAPEAVLIANDEGRLLLVNKQAESLFGLSREVLMQKSLQLLLPDIDISKYSFTEPFQNNKAKSKDLISTSVVDSDELTRPVEIAVATTETEAGNTVTCLIRDVSDRAQLQSQLSQSQKMDAIGKLTGGMAHDFNNMLGVIMGNLDLASRKVVDNAAVIKRLNTAKKAAERGAELTKRMLAVARRQPLQPKPTNINLILDEMADILPRTLGPDIEMEYDTKSTIPDVLVDESGLENAFLNLAINSRDAMPDGGKFYITTDVLHLQKDQALSLKDDMRPGSYVQIAVTDTGEGMSKETLSRVFEPFFTTKESGKGTGLGLAMIYGFAKQSGGNVRIYSELGVGTTIDIFLPVSDEKAADTPHSQSNLLPEEVGAGGEKILIVDDEYELLEVATTFLEEMGFTVLAATDGKQALQTIESNPDIQILLTDVVMPGGVNGVELARALMDNLPEAKVLYMSGFPSDVFADRTGSQLDAPLITKPYSKETLAKALSELLHGET